MAKRSSADELSASVEARIARRRLDRQERYLALIDAALRARIDNGFDETALRAIEADGQNERAQLEALAGGRVVGRRRPKLTGTGTCKVYIDECGAHSLKAKGEFKSFALGAIIVADGDYPTLDKRWKSWKRIYLGSSQKLVHEPDIRDGHGSFSCHGDSAKRRRAVAALARFIERQRFGAVVVVLHREEYVAAHGLKALDDSLPQYPYLMTVDFLAERVAMALQSEYGGAKAQWVLESRGPKEDALVQYEFTRLFLDGTSYVSASWFRQQFFPGVEFRGKRDNLTGLQLADLLARPCAEKVLNPSSTPDRWLAFRSRLVRGEETAHSIVGMKIVPWDDKYNGIWES